MEQMVYEIEKKVGSKVKSSLPLGPGSQPPAAHTQGSREWGQEPVTWQVGGSPVLSQPFLPMCII